MKAIILGAGRATRLFPLTKDIPVSMLDLGGKTLLQHQIDVLKENGVNDIVVVFGHNAAAAENAYGNIITTVYNPFFGVSGQIGSINAAKDFLNDDIIYIHGDTLFGKGTIKALLNDKSDACIVIEKRGSYDEETEKVKIAGGNLRMIDKTRIPENEVNGEWIGVAKFSKKASLKFKESMNAMLRTTLTAMVGGIIQHMVDSGAEIRCMDVIGPWIEIDFEKDFQKAITEVYPKVKI